eukprot:3568458-Rhodomonas_salina.1
MRQWRPGLRRTGVDELQICLHQGRIVTLKGCQRGWGHLPTAGPLCAEQKTKNGLQPETTLNFHVKPRSFCESCRYGVNS